MNRQNRISAAFALSTLACASAANADFLYYAWPWSDSTGSPSIATAARTMKTADDFTLWMGNGQNYTIDRIVGAVTSAIGGSTTQYKVEVRADAAGTPGSLIHTQLATNLSDFGTAPTSGNSRYYVVAFDMSLSLAAGARYWVSIMGVGGSTPQVTWVSTTAPSVNGSGALFSDTAYGSAWSASSYWGGVSRDTAMYITGTQAVPTPAAAAMGGLGMLLASRRRRRA